MNTFFERMKNSILIKYSLFLIPVIWGIALLAGLTETYFYPGFILKHTHIDSTVIYLAFGIIGILSLFYPKWKSVIDLHLFQRLNYWAIYIFGLSFYFFYLLEKIKYPNYVFSTFHINLMQIAGPLGLSIFAYIISSKETLSAIHSNPKRLFKWFPVVAILLWIFIPNLTGILLTSFRDVSFIIKNPSASYDQKMEYKLGKQFYDYVLFIKQNTPENSKILLPPFPAYPWPQTGNIPYMTYFLSPRVLLNGGEVSPKYNLENEGIDFVLIAWGEADVTSEGYTHGWPKFDVPAEETIYMDGREIRTKPGNYVYKEIEGQRLWGLIKVKK